ncbi:MAG: isocitrate lyase/PEP mutase family protein [Chloroflexota bacterium]
MNNQQAQAHIFKDDHIKGDPLLLHNVWDAGTARLVEQIGARAIATGSLAVAAAHGYDDGEQLPFDLVVANARRIVSAVNVPVSIDIEGGYGQDTDTISANIAQIIEAGAVGVNFEDQIIGKDELYPVNEQCRRIAAVRQAADTLSLPLFINARTDIFLKLAPERHEQRHVDEAIERAEAYAGAGADGFFVPGLRNPTTIETLCRQISLPINIMFLPDSMTLDQTRTLGVARISYGPYLYQQMAQMIQSELAGML